jgi:hypothetical protein
MYENITINQAWWNTSLIPALERPRQEDCEFEANMGSERDLISKQTTNKNVTMKPIILYC